LLAESAENIEDLRTLELLRKQRKHEIDSFDGDREMMLESEANSDKKSRNMVVSGMNPDDVDEMQHIMHNHMSSVDDDFMNQ
jgi:hypothetical protein